MVNAQRRGRSGEQVHVPLAQGFVVQRSEHLKRVGGVRRLALQEVAEVFSATAVEGLAPLPELQFLKHLSFSFAQVLGSSHAPAEHARVCAPTVLSVRSKSASSVQLNSGVGCAATHASNSSRVKSWYGACW